MSDFAHTGEPVVPLLGGFCREPPQQHATRSVRGHGATASGDNHLPREYAPVFRASPRGRFFSNVSKKLQYSAGISL
jgi:hypothetical protein